MKRGLLLFVLVASALVVWLLLKHKPDTQPATRKISPAAAISNALALASPQAKAAIESSFTGTPAATATGKPLPSATQFVIPAPAQKPFTPEIAGMEPLAVLENTRTAIHNYGQRFGGNPVGSNAEITRALGGENPGQVNYLNAEDGLRVNDRGELMDAWGTPFFFHQLSGTEMEIHSAGPDKILWTLDDLVTR
jgi:hypothetical protein